MSTISEQGDDQALQKRIRQAVYDIRYKARKEEIDLRHAYSVYIGKSGLDQNGKEAVQNKLFGKPEEQAESTVLETAGENKYKVRATDKSTGKTYIRFANRGKINKLRSKGSVELTGHGIPKGSKTSSTSQVKKAKGAKSLANLSSNLRTAKKYEPTKITARSTPPKPKKMKKETTKEDYLADAAAVAPIKNKKIGGEKVDNSKLIKVYPNDGSDPTIGNIKSSFKPVGQVVSEILNKEAYTVTAADKKGNTPAWQGYKAGKKNVKTGQPMYKAADHLAKEEHEIVDEGALVKAAQGAEKVGGAIKKGVKAFNKADAAVTKATMNRVVKPVAKAAGKAAVGTAKAAGRAVVGGVKGAVKGALNREEFVDPFYKSVSDDVDDGTGRDMYTKWNNVKNRLRSMGLKCNYELEGNELIEGAVEYFYEQGISEEQLDLIVEEIGLDDFVEFVLDPHQDLVEARSARKAAASAPSYEKVKAKVDAGDAARKAAGKGEYATTAAAKRNYGDEEAPEGKPAAKKKAKVVTPPAKKAATKKKVTAAVKKVKSTEPTKTATKKDGLKDGLRGKITKFVKKGVERHQKARAAGKVPEKRAKEFGKGVVSGVKTAVKAIKDVKKVVSEEEERLRASGKFTEEQIEAILESAQYDELDNELLQIVEDNLGVKTEDEILELMESGWHRRNPGKKHPLESGSSKVTPRPVSDKEKKSTDKSDRMYVAMRRVKDRQQGYSKEKSDAADRLHGEYTSRQSKIKKGATPKEAAAQSHGKFAGKGFNIKRGGRGEKGFHGPGTDRGTGNKARRRAGQEVRDTRKEHHEKDVDGNVIPHKTAPLTEGALVRQLLEGKA
jgi:hypothetical protein